MLPTGKVAGPAVSGCACPRLPEAWYPKPPWEATGVSEKSGGLKRFLFTQTVGISCPLWRLPVQNMMCYCGVPTPSCEKGTSGSLKRNVVSLHSSTLLLAQNRTNTETLACSDVLNPDLERRGASALRKLRGRGQLGALPG